MAPEIAGVFGRLSRTVPESMNPTPVGGSTGVGVGAVGGSLHATGATISRPGQVW